MGKALPTETEVAVGALPRPAPQGLCSQFPHNPGFKPPTPARLTSAPLEVFA